MIGCLGARVFPFSAGEAADEEEDDADTHVCQQTAHPDFVPQGREEGKEPRVLLRLFPHHDADTQGHVGFGEIHHLLTTRVDC